MVHVLTSACVNYLPKVRLLYDSLKRYHPEFVVHLILADRVPEWLDTQDRPFDHLIRLEDLGIQNMRSWVFRHSVVELSTAVKPFALRQLLDLPGCDYLLYFDPDIVFFSPLDDLMEEFTQGGILLTPHLTRPEASLEAIVDTEILILRHGIFNLGFIGVKNDKQGRALIDWWATRLYHFCAVALEVGLFTDQKWMDLVPVFFEGVRVIKSSRFNVARWNLATRTLAGSMTQGFTVDGQPLGFYHFSGFDSGDHRNVAMKNSGNNPAVLELDEWYAKSTVEDERALGTPWGYGVFDNGEPVTQAHRDIYKIRKDLQEAFPEPLAVESGPCYYNWFKLRAELEYPELIQSTSGVISRARLYLKAALADHRYGLSLPRRFLDVLRTEGYAGLRRRLRVHLTCL